MIERVINWSIENRFLVIFFSMCIFFWGILALKKTPIDAIPDLSDVQVIVKTSYPGQAPEVVQDQVTYPISTALLAVPGAQTVRGFSYYGDSYIYIRFDDDTDIYWARSRVAEYIDQVSHQLPAGVKPQLGPDASGVGWIFIYALTDTSGKHDLAELTAYQNWFLKYELQAIPGVAEVATVGGMVKEYQVVIDPVRLKAFGVPLNHIRRALQRGNREMGASVIEMAEAEYMIRVSGNLQGVEDIENIGLGIDNKGVPLFIKDVAHVRLGPAMRRGIAELNGNGEVVGGIIVMRDGENAAAVIQQVNARLASLKRGLPETVELKVIYDRSQLILGAVDHLWHTLWKELVVVIAVCLIFLMHLPSSFVVVMSLPLAIVAAFIVMQWQGISANIMSLGGIAVAIGTMIDGAIVMLENLHKHMQKKAFSAESHWQLVKKSSSEVGPSLFFSLLIITVSFLPVFALEAQEGRMFTPLAYTKTYAMAAAAILAVTLVPVLMGFLVRGNVRPEKNNLILRGVLKVYRPTLTFALNAPYWVMALTVIFFLSVFWPLSRLGSEFVPPLDEGDLMYMPTTYPAISIGKARELLQQTDRLIATVPEVNHVFGKVGRAETATDPAPLTMIETFIHLKPKSQWREGMTTQKLTETLNRLITLPGVTNAWVMPIKTRIDMLSTGIKTPLGIKVAGPNIQGIEKIGEALEGLLTGMAGTASVYAERTQGGRYLNIDLDRQKIARFHLDIIDVQNTIASSVGGAQITQTREGLERYGVSLRYPQHFRDSPRALASLPIMTPQGDMIALSDIASIAINDGPAGIKSENGRLTGWVLVDIEDSNMMAYVKRAKARVESEIILPPGYSLTWAGQFESIQRVTSALKLLIPMTLALIVLLLYWNFRRIKDVLIILTTLPVAVVGGIWLIELLAYRLSTAVAIGLIAVLGIAVEMGVIMLLFLNQATAKIQQGRGAGYRGKNAVKVAVMEGATSRLRPILMTSAATVMALFPILLSHGLGSEVMQRLAAPMIGGIVSVMLLSLIVLPVVYYLFYRNEH